MRLPSKRGLFQGARLVFKAARACKGYFGSKERVADLILEQVPKGSLFVEGFCGGASLSYIMKRHGRETLSGDMSYYAYLHAAGQIVPNAPPDFQAVKKQIEELVPANGYATEALGNKLPCDPRWVDAYCTRFRDEPSVLLALGKALDTLRAAGHFPTWTNKKVTTAEVLDKVLTNLNWICAEIVPGKSQARWGVALDLVKSRSRFTSSSVLYLDPAWPFSDGKTAEGFYGFPADIGRILKQEHYPVRFLGEAEHTEMVCQVVGEFLNRGGGKVLVSTQSTNSPHPEVVRDRLSKYGKAVLNDTRKVLGGTWKKGFTEYLIILTRD